ncbi:SidA/IucD/PvdA family monooxygenase [Gordonia sp. ABSL1-1]|uniref:lysine N(6)-hydroxylase/L-ornithine N(5)-oxygenase family protein n=1 Tax=Gordonia sp. ABSL1-1 TaxID=3053923 RepID=UPI002572F377|nr:SidA/IucD/PvdA family monooxygenase [Gordonia sp. ABSL1-1]MDL9935873.1 SidA/IucD/PvdA family monooxygenase [Gordonia sp. ABSL1-1]
MSQSAPVDVVGIGFGPANLGLAIAIEEHNRTPGVQAALSARFVERKTRFSWHPGMLLPGATLQVSFLKDLVTQRNSRSEYSFLNYLSVRGRLSHFINRQDFFPLRAEFNDYLCWAADRVSVPISYGTEVTSVAWRNGHFEVDAGYGGVIAARNVVLGGGLRAKLPAGVQPSARVFHNHQFLQRFAELPTARHGRYVVVGAGQSAAEVALHLLDNTDAEIHAVFAKYGYTPADDSPYANRIFDADAVDEHFGAEPVWRDRLMSYHRSTNYSAVDADLIAQLYRREYRERVDGRRRLYVHGASEIVSLDDRGDEVEVGVAHGLSGTSRTLQADAVVMATGFEPARIDELLGDDLAGSAHLDDHGRPVLDRQYRLSTDEHIRGQIFVQGNSEHTHGLSSTLLSNIAIRSGEITATLAATRMTGDPRPDSLATASAG